MPTDSASRHAALTLPALLGALAGIYVTQTMVTIIAMQSLPALMRAAGASLQLIGLSSLFMLPWALRFLWAPMVERWRLPKSTTGRRSRIFILRGQWLLAAGMMTMSGAAMTGWISLEEHGALMLGLFLLAAILAATVDIACGGFAVDQLSDTRRGWGNTAKVGGSYIGMLLGGSCFLLLADRYSWQIALGAAGVAIFLLTLPLLAIHEPERTQAETSEQRPSLLQAWRRPQVRLGLLLAFALGAGSRTTIGMIGPMLLDKGASMNELAWIFGGLSVGAGLAGTALGGVLVRYAPGWQAVRIVIAIKVLILIALSWGITAMPLTLLIPLVVLFSLSMACGFVAIYSALMGLASPNQPGVDFALFQCADALAAMAGGVAGGWLAQRWGYSLSFALAAGMTAVAALLLISLERRVARAADIELSRTRCMS